MWYINFILRIVKKKIRSTPLNLGSSRQHPGSMTNVGLSNARYECWSVGTETNTEYSRRGKACSGRRQSRQTQAILASFGGLWRHFSLSPLTSPRFNLHSQPRIFFVSWDVRLRRLMQIPTVRHRQFSVPWIVVSVRLSWALRRIFAE